MSSLIILINLILACSSVLSDRVDVEPKCSPFEYEERTLMKTIRLEHEMELSNKKADDNDKLMREEIDSLKLRLNMLNEQLEHKKQPMEEAGLEDSMKLRLNTLNDQLENIEKAIELVKADQEVWKQKLEEIQNQPSYAFHAMWVANVPPSLNDALKFSRVILNDHDVYNSDTGEFKTPVDGTYMFTANVCVYTNKDLSLQFLADATVIGSFLTGDKDWSSCTSSTAMSQLLKGQIVKLVVVDRYGSGNIVNNYDNGFLSSFSGMLIK